MSRVGRSRPPGGRRPRDMRERADEMVALLDEAAPRAARGRRRRATAVPAAVAAFGALSIGGVGLALGLTPTGAEGVLPASPSPALADPASSPAGTSTAGTAGGPTGAVLDPAVAGADLVRADDHGGVPAGAPGPAPAAAPPVAGPHVADPTSTTRPRATSTRPSSTTTRPRPTSSRPAPTGVPRSASTRPAARPPSAAPRPLAQRATVPGPAGASSTPTATTGGSTGGRSPAG